MILNQIYLGWSSGNLLQFLNTEKSTTLVWVFMKPGKKMKPIKKNNFNLELWRTENQNTSKISPLRLVVDSPKIFPRLINLPENAKYAQVLVLGREKDEDLLVHNYVDVNNGEADFNGFRVTKQLPDENNTGITECIFTFNIFNENREPIQFFLESGRIQLVEDSRNLRLVNSIECIEPFFGRKGEIHQVSLYGSLKVIPSFQLLVNQTAVPFSVESDGSLKIFNVSSNTPQTLTLTAVSGSNCISDSKKFLIYDETNQDQIHALANEYLASQHQLEQLRSYSYPPGFQPLNHYSPHKGYPLVFLNEPKKENVAHFANARDSLGRIHSNFFSPIIYTS